MEMGILRRGAELANEMQRKQAAGEEVDVNTKNRGENWLAVRESMVAQMHEVSQFMKLFKQRVSIWFNRSKGTYGTLWADRFKSQLVQDGGDALRTVAAYIDLNGVRAGLAADPKDYRFCGYAEALAGNEALQQQYARIEWAAASKPGEIGRTEQNGPQGTQNSEKAGIGFTTEGQV
jgi:putative transposase